MIQLKYINPNQVLHKINKHFDIPIIDLDTINIDKETLKLLPPKLVFKQHYIPINKTNQTLLITTNNPFKLSTFDELQLLTKLTIELILTNEHDITKFIHTHYKITSNTLETLTNKKHDLIDLDKTSTSEIKEAQKTNIVKLVNNLLLKNIHQRTTNIHIEPYKSELKMHYQIDKILMRANIPTTINHFRNTIINKLKIITNLNITKKHRPQDNKITIQYKSNKYNLQLSIIPMLKNKNIILHILNKSTSMFDLKILKIPNQTLQI